MRDENINYLDLIREQNTCFEITYYTPLICKVTLLTKHKIII